ncbi:ABC transporter permease [Acinetobacter sp. C_4_1]|uniref:ABC transporter permease n=1 Tax=unclassified Acinetobacter TaxID=196816 RepID=UPI0021B7F0AA|nr:MULTISPECIES: ABC transporter permease [unclassified Acinetobacter]MCT8088335.1 ABC transporter permease [Acinetobacter sp. F_3_1]MCT8097704.1 ABC transporter permease [Acinetobacter sp. C_3_1]MCT8100360.1 ABC transporter permease [Acinetobacter sp. C_4_1]MCT8133921.1 ABC transporter permease [Acinetobacter sp. T_3_1]
MFSQKIQNIYQLGCKELWSLWRDPVMLILIIYTFTVAIYTAATAMTDSLNMAPIAIVDEDHSTLSERITSAFYPPYFIPQSTELNYMDAGMDAGEFTFALNIPVNFQEDVLAGKEAAVQVNVDATRMSQAMTGAGYIQQIIQSEVSEYVLHNREVSSMPVELEMRARFNPLLDQKWFGSVMEIINNVAMLSIILTGAALIREREHGTVEHLMVMPVTVFEIMMSKVWSMSLVVLIAAFTGLKLVVQLALQVPVEGNLLLFFFGALLTLFATTSMGIYLATMSKSMPQFGLLMMLILIPMEMLSGGMTPRESMPEVLQYLMLIAPTTHFVELAQAILYRNAGLNIVWPSFLWLVGIAVLFFYVAWKRFKDTIHTMT